MDLRALNIPATYSSRSALNTGGENSIVLLEAYKQKRKEYECRKRPSETACTRAPRDQRDPSCTVSNVDTATTKTRHWHGHAADCNQACESTIPRRLRHARNTPTSPPETLDRTTSHCAVTIFASSPVSCCWMSCNTKARTGPAGFLESQISTNHESCTSKLTAYRPSLMFFFVK